ncbi:sucrase ferredoxin [Amycolatopsis pittospori]|uniref:sucrase ferredoxin n=1 Tax=Amycolatopsis pittospori TaxID=2749434 RepID=UPI0015F00906|nr:sucrase ferredoxin [Amycolatopsis pittospori]
MTAIPAGRCADLAEAAGDPGEGTAPPAERWLLIEHPGPWGRVALKESGLDPGAVASLTSWAARVDGRIALVRRAGRRPGARDRPSRWFRIDARPGHEGIRTGEFTDAAELSRVPDTPGHVMSGPLVLVCVHGRHDTCCAVRGRSLAAALAEEFPDATWECSHLGGCRFAPSMVVLPHGFTFGGVRPDEAGDVVHRYLRGTVGTEFLRGRSSLSQLVQAAQQHARAATGATGIDALRLVEDVRDSGPARRVRFAEPDCTVYLRERHVPADRRLTCASEPVSAIRVFELLGLEYPGSRS